MRTPLHLILAAAACSGDKTDTADTDDTDAGTTDTDTNEPAGCTAPSEGVWTMSGSCFGMDMVGTLTLEADGCSFTFSDWDMAMSVPEGGTVSGNAVTFTGAGWNDCTGTTDGTSMSGGCGDGCTYDGSFDG